MKKIISLLIVVFCLSLITGCDKTEDFYPEEDYAEFKGAKIKVQPSNASDVLTKAQEDWQNINDALQNAKSGEVVQLGAGLFYLHKSIIRWDFNGILRGSGINETTIQTVPGELFDVSDCPPLKFSFKTTDGFFMFCFAYHNNTELRNVSVSDMTIIVDQPTIPYYQYKLEEDPEEGNTLQALNVQYENLDNDVDNRINLNVTCKNIKIVGEENNEKYLNHGYSLYAGVAAFGTSNGTFEAKNVKIRNANYAIIANFFNGESSLVTLKNCMTSNNKHGLLSALAHSWNILNSDFQSSKSASLYLNKFDNRTDVEMPAGKSIVKNNKINLSGGVAMAAYNMDNTELKNNVFYGSGYTGIYSQQGSNWHILNNNFCDVLNPILGGTLFLIYPTDVVINNNFNQIVVGPGIDDSSNIISEGKPCND